MRTFPFGLLFRQIIRAVVCLAPKHCSPSWPAKVPAVGSRISLKELQNYRLRGVDCTGFLGASSAVLHPTSCSACGPGLTSLLHGCVLVLWRSGEHHPSCVETEQGRRAVTTNQGLDENQTVACGRSK